jgi:hypothetical protein
MAPFAHQRDASLQTVDLGIAPGFGTGIAMTVAAGVLVQHGLLRVVETIDSGRWRFTSRGGIFTLAVSGFFCPIVSGMVVWSLSATGNSHRLTCRCGGQDQRRETSPPDDSSVARSTVGKENGEAVNPTSFRCSADPREF